MALYLLDANVLITARDTYYDFIMVLEFWTWLEYHARVGNVKMTTETLSEILDGPLKQGKDLLYDWVNKKAVRAYLDGGPANIKNVQHVLAHGYGSGMTDAQINGLRADPFLVAHGMAASGCIVVSNEHTKPSRAPHNRKVPDACNILGVRCINGATFIRELGFNTTWAP